MKQTESTKPEQAGFSRRLLAHGGKEHKMFLQNELKLRASIKHFNSIQDREFFLTFYKDFDWKIGESVDHKKGLGWLNISNESIEDVMFLVENNMFNSCFDFESDKL